MGLTFNKKNLAKLLNELGVSFNGGDDSPSLAWGQLSPLPPDKLEAGDGGAINPLNPFTELDSDDGSGDNNYTLADGEGGVTKKIKLVNDGGADAIVVPSKLNGARSISLNDEGDYIVLVWDDANKYWELVENNGCIVNE